MRVKQEAFRLGKKSPRHCLYILQNANVLSEGTHPKIFMKYLGKGRAEVLQKNDIRKFVCHFFDF